MGKIYTVKFTKDGKMEECETCKKPVATLIYKKKTYCSVCFLEAKK